MALGRARRRRLPPWRCGRAPASEGGGLRQQFRQGHRCLEAIGFYTWSDELKRTFRFLRYLQHKWPTRSGAPDQIAAVLAADAGLMKRYKTMLDFYAHLTNPFNSPSFGHLADPAHAGKSVRGIELALGFDPKPDGPRVQFLPNSGSKEVRLFNRLFGPSGLPPGADDCARRAG